MTANVRKLLIAVRDGQSYRGSAATYEAALKAGYLVYEDTYTRNSSGEYGRGYVLTGSGRAALESSGKSIKSLRSKYRK